MSLSGGERGRVHLAKVLRRSPNVILLDEPTNDLGTLFAPPFGRVAFLILVVSLSTDVETLRSLENALLDFDGCAIVVSHDRYFLDRVCTHTVAFEGDGKVCCQSHATCCMGCHNLGLPMFPGRVLRRELC